MHSHYRETCLQKLPSVINKLATTQSKSNNLDVMEVHYPNIHETVYIKVNKAHEFEQDNLSISFRPDDTFLMPFSSIKTIYE